MRLLTEFLVFNIDLPSGWFHLVINFDGRMNHIQNSFSSYLNGAMVGIIHGHSGQQGTEGDGRIGIGRLFTDSNRLYASADIDELMFFNRALPDEQITMLGQLPN